MTNNPSTLDTSIDEISQNMQSKCQIEDAEVEAALAAAYQRRIEDPELEAASYQRRIEDDAELVLDEAASYRGRIEDAELVLDEAASYRGRIEDSKLVVMDKKRKHSSDYGSSGANKESEQVTELMVDDDSSKRMKNMPPLLPVEFKDVMSKLAEGKNLSEAKHLFQKTLVSTDCSLGQNRPSVTINCWAVFTDGGMTYLGDYCETDDHINCLLVNIVEPNLDVGVVHISRLDIENERGMKFLLDGMSWDRIVKQHELEEGMVVQLWAFKISAKMWFALVKLP